MESAEVLGQLGALTALKFCGRGTRTEGLLAAFLEMLGAHPSLQQWEVPSSFLLAVKIVGVEAQLPQGLRRRGWVRMERADGCVRFGAPGLCVQL